MLPYFMRYDHTNYGRWGLTHLSEIHQFPEEVRAKFGDGNFMVQCANQKFSQVDRDQCQEWLSGTAKR